MWFNESNGVMKTKEKIANMFDDLLHLFYPRTCVACYAVIDKYEHYVCFHCELNLPKSNYFRHTVNPLKLKFFGKVLIEDAHAFFNFQKGNAAQKILHILKYQNDPEIGVYFGKQFGKELLAKNRISGIDYIVPVPLHPTKQKSRGYNQSEEIGKGLSEALSVEMNINILKRIKATDSQTKKNAHERWQNMQAVFTFVDGADINGKNILLVDDVITTGSTLEVCAQILLENGCNKVYIAALAAPER